MILGNSLSCELQNDYSKKTSIHHHNCVWVLTNSQELGNVPVCVPFTLFRIPPPSFLNWCLLSADSPFNFLITTFPLSFTKVARKTWPNVPLLSSSLISISRQSNFGNDVPSFDLLAKDGTLKEAAILAENITRFTTGTFGVKLRTKVHFAKQFLVRWLEWKWCWWCNFLSLSPTRYLTGNGRKTGQKTTWSLTIWIMQLYMLYEILLLLTKPNDPFEKK